MQHWHELPEVEVRAKHKATIHACFCWKRKKCRPKGKKHIKSALELAMEKRKEKRGKGQQMMMAWDPMMSILGSQLVIMMERLSCREDVVLSL